MEILWVILVVQAIVSAFMAGFIAGEKGYPSGSWGALGLFFGIFGLIGAVGLPVKKGSVASGIGRPELLKGCPSCFEQIKIQARTCRHCGNKFSDKNVVEEIGLQLEGYTDREIKMAFYSLKDLPPDLMLPNLHIMAERLLEKKPEHEITSEYQNLFKEIINKMLETDREGSILKLEKILIKTQLSPKVKMLIEILTETKKPSSVSVLLEKMRDCRFENMIYSTFVEFGPNAIPFMERYIQEQTDKKEKKRMANLIKEIERRAADPSADSLG